MLARDLQDNFYEFFKDYFETLISLLDPSEPELLEDIFTAFSYFFKFCQRHLTNDLMKVFRCVHFIQN
jgi:U3 small nucleolar RNA-associated protein 20